MDQTAFNGVVTKYAFSYKTSIKQLVRGEEYPYRTLELNHDNSNKDLRGYHRCFYEPPSVWPREKATWWEQRTGVERKIVLFVFDNTANGLSSTHGLHVLSPDRRVLAGEISIVIRFGQNPGVNLTVLIYGEFENLLEINRNKMVIYDMYRQ